MTSPSETDSGSSTTSSTQNMGSGDASTNPNPDEHQVSKPGFFQITMSVLAAALGVQTDANRERDFSQSSPMPYIVGGIIFTVLFVLTLIGVVMMVLPD